MKISSSEHWQRIDAVFGEALPLHRSARAAYLDESCSTDPELRAEVERLLAASDEAGDFLEVLDATRAAGLLEPSPQTVTAIGRYKVIRKIGSGGMGVVHLAEDPALKRQVAVKLLPPWLDASPAAKHRLIEEARAASAIDHPNVATVHEIGETEDGRLFIAMSYYEGDTLRGRMARGPLSVAEATDIALQTARGLSAAHFKGIVHRDIKPENILLRLDGTVKVLDFGIAAVEEHAARGTAKAIGTAAYMSPEQTMASSVDSRSDIWSLGIVLYEMLARERPFGGRTRDEIFASIRRDPLRMNRHIEHDVPTTLRLIVERCLRKELAARYQSADELARDLESVVAASSSRRLSGFIRRHVGASAVVAGVLLAAVAVAIYTAWPAARADPSQSTIAVFPFTPGAPDTLLERLGRDLVTTLSGSLDGIGDLRALDARAAIAPQRRGIALSIGEQSTVAHDMGAGIVIKGSLARVGTRVRADAILLSATGTMPLARVSATTAPEDLAHLSDSLAWALQRELWRVRGMPALAATAVTTRSFRALRVYFEGDRLANEYRMREAAAAFARAFATDPTFWFAYWRYAWANSFHQLPVDPAITAAYVEHRAEFPVPDRLLIETRMTADLSSRLAQLESLVTRFPNHWPGWFELGELRVRQAPFAGRSLAEAESPLLRTVSLNPRFVPGWDRLLWVAIARRDTALSARALRALEQLHYDSTSMLDDRFNVMLLYRHLHHLARSGGVPDSSLADSVATGLSLTGFRPSVDGMPDRMQSGIARFEFHGARIDQAERMIRAGTRPWFQWHVIANSWAARGAWDSALVTVDRAVVGSPHPGSGLYAYRLAAVGVWLGAVDPVIATAWRRRAIATYDRMPSGDRAELAWTDGLLAYVRHDGEALSRARSDLQLLRVPEVGRMDSSLNALAKDLTGKTRDGIRLLLALDEDRFHVSNGHPYVTGVNRITASRWLLAAGDTARAARLLTWHEAIGNDGPHATHANAVLAPFAYLARARILEAQGHRSEAHANYARFLSNYNAPVQAHRALVEEARAALTRVSTR